MFPLLILHKCDVAADELYKFACWLADLLSCRKWLRSLKMPTWFSWRWTWMLPVWVWVWLTSWWACRSSWITSAAARPVLAQRSSTRLCTVVKIAVKHVCGFCSILWNFLHSHTRIRGTCEHITGLCTNCKVTSFIYWENYERTCLCGFVVLSCGVGCSLQAMCKNPQPAGVTNESAERIK